MISIPAKLECTHCLKTVSISLRFADYPRIEVMRDTVIINIDSIPTDIALLRFDYPDSWSFDWADRPLCPACTLQHGGTK